MPTESSQTLGGFGWGEDDSGGMRRQKMSGESLQTSCRSILRPCCIYNTCVTLVICLLNQPLHHIIQPEHAPPAQTVDPPQHSVLTVQFQEMIPQAKARLRFCSVFFFFRRHLRFLMSIMIPIHPIRPVVMPRIVLGAIQCLAKVCEDVEIC